MYALTCTCMYTLIYVHIHLDIRIYMSNSSTNAYATSKTDLCFLLYRSEMFNTFDLSCQFGWRTKNIRVLELHLEEILFGAFTLNLRTGWYCRNFTVSYIFTNAAEIRWVLHSSLQKRKWRTIICYKKKQTSMSKRMVTEQLYTGKYSYTACSLPWTGLGLKLLSYRNC
jgi:hypothetical protein